MNPNNKRAAESDVFTAILAVAAIAVYASAIFIAYLCYTNYGTIFKIAESVR